MPLGKPRLSQPMPPVEESKLVTIRLPRPPQPQRVVRVPAFPTAAAPLKQLTVIDHKVDTGAPYIRSYVERYAMKEGDPYYQEARHTTTLFCKNKLQFQVALTACHHYCQAPCLDHITKLQEMGWSRGAKPPSEVRRVIKKDGDDEG